MKTLQRLLATTFKRIRRNPYNASGAVAVMFLTFLVGGIFILINLSSNTILNYYESRPQVIAFLKDGTTKEQLEAIKADLNKTGKIASLKYVSKEEALQIYKERFKSQPELTEFVTADILPASFNISTTKIEYQADIAKLVSAEPQVDQVFFYQKLVENLQNWAKTIRIAGIVALVFLTLTSIFVTLVVIGLNISLHKEEIEIMKLVGATERYIRTPFLFEGAFYGLLSALLSVGTAWVIVTWLTPFIQAFFTDIPLVPVQPFVFYYLFLVEGAVGIFVGSFGSFIATRRYLKV